MLPLLTLHRSEKTTSARRHRRSLHLSWGPADLRLPDGAKIYPWGEAQVLKLFQPRISARTAKNEQRKTAVAAALGLPVPTMGSRGQFADRYSNYSLFCMAPAIQA